MKKLILLIACLMAFANTAEARRCLRGAVWDVNEKGESRLVSCAKWERPVEARLAEQEAINRALGGEPAPEKEINHRSGSGNEDMSYLARETRRGEKVEDNKTPALGKLQNKLDDIGSSIFGLIGF